MGGLGHGGWGGGEDLMTRRGRAAGLPSADQREGVAQPKKKFFFLWERA